MGSHRQCQLILGFFAILIMEISSSAAFIVPDVRFVPSSSRKFSKRLGLQDSLALRGGNQDESEIAEPREMVEAKCSGMSVVSAFVLAGAECYSSLLEKTPIFTKSATAGLIFAASDVLAQRIERNADKGGKLEKTRTITASLVGFLYFGPAAHFWYEHIFILFPGTSLISTLKKAAMGQLVFGPSFTCIFFATSLLQAGEFSLGNWFKKIRADLPGAWLAGSGFWPLVDLVSYSLVPKRWIPLFINICSLIWNIYLSLIANRKAKGAALSK